MIFENDRWVLNPKNITEAITIVDQILNLNKRIIFHENIGLILRLEEYNNFKRNCGVFIDKANAEIKRALKVIKKEEGIKA